MTSSLPLFPLHTVLYPGGELPLKIFEARYVDLLSTCLREDVGFGVAPILKGHETGVPAETHGVGTLARITSWDQGADGLLHIVARGAGRFRISAAASRPNGLLDAEVEWFKDDDDDPPLPQEYAHLASLFDTLWRRVMPDRPVPSPLASRSLCYRFAELLPLDMSARVAVLSEGPASLQLQLIESGIRAIFR